MHIKVWMVITFVSMAGFRMCLCYLYHVRQTPNSLLVVKHSQRFSATPLKPWIVAKMEGTIVCGHCTCMAGLGEACSHIAALLFTFEKNSQHQNITTCTPLPCSWLPPSYQAVTYSEIAGIDLTTPQLKRKRSESGDHFFSAAPKNKITPPSHVEVGTFYKNLF